MREPSRGPVALARNAGAKRRFYAGCCGAVQVVHRAGTYCNEPRADESGTLPSAVRRNSNCSQAERKQCLQMEDPATARVPQNEHRRIAIACHRHMPKTNPTMTMTAAPISLRRMSSERSGAATNFGAAAGWATVRACAEGIGNSIHRSSACMGGCSTRAGRLGAFAVAGDVPGA